MLSSTIFLGFWGKALSCRFSFQQHSDEINSSLSVVNLRFLNFRSATVESEIDLGEWLWNFNTHVSSEHIAWIHLYVGKNKGLFLLFKPNFPLFSFTFPHVCWHNDCELYYSFQYCWVIDNVVVLNFCNDFGIAKIGTWKLRKTGFFY